MSDPNDILFGSSVPSAKFHSIGDSVTGTITDIGASQQTEYRKPGSTGPIKKKFWPDGQPMMQVIVTLATSQRDPSIEDDDGQRRVFIKGKQLTNAVRDAVRVAGARKLEGGGRLTVTFVREEDTGAGNPAKVYTVEYVRPSAQAAADVIGDPWANAAPIDPVGFPGPAPESPVPVSQPLPSDLGSLSPEVVALLQRKLAEQQGATS